MALLERWLEETSALGRPGWPLVTLSYAQGLDGSISLRRGEPLAISSLESQELTHRLRAAHDAILVGIGTILSDDPQLNVRLMEGTDPQVVVLDSRLRLPLDAKVLKSDKPPWVFCTSIRSLKAQQALEKKDVRVERQDQDGEMVNLEQMLGRVHELGINTLMVEGGGQVISSFLGDGLIDRAMITVAPTFIGGYKIPGGNLTADALPQMKNMRIEDAGKDIVLFGRLDGVKP
jgi:3,4-dihydroxy 2-butanone 4-phosphate synthase/GTP cyclohydrolase II